MRGKVERHETMPTLMTPSRRVPKDSPIVDGTQIEAWASLKSFRPKGKKGVGARTTTIGATRR